MGKDNDEKTLKKEAVIMGWAGKGGELNGNAAILLGPLFEKYRSKANEISQKRFGMSYSRAVKAADRYGIETLDPKGILRLQDELAREKSAKDAAWAAAYAPQEPPKPMVNRARPADAGTPIQKSGNAVTQGVSRNSKGSIPNAGTTLLNPNDPKRRRTLLG